MIESAHSTVTVSPDWFENAVLIYGPRKAGTTLLHNLLDGSDRLFVYPEEIKMKRLALVKVTADNAAQTYNRYSRIPKATLPRFDQSRYRAAWDALLKRGDKHAVKEVIAFDLQCVIDSITGTPPAVPQMWCAKEVGGDTTAVIEWWLKNFSNPRVVFILRDPLMVTRAVLNDRRRKERRLSIREIAHETLDPIRVVRAQKALLDRPQVVAIAYEDLVADTAKTMARIAAFLGIENGEYLTRPSIFHEPVTVRTASKASSGVFDSGADWRAGLTLRERLVVGAISAFARLGLNYKETVARLPAR